jgi:probable HAF family extracellular repeat protein
MPSRTTTTTFALTGFCVLLSLLFASPASAAPHSKYVVTDLGTLGGANAVAFWVTDSGDVVGFSDTGQMDSNGLFTQHGFRWHRGTMHDLGTPNGNFTYAFSANDEGRVAGQTFLPDDFTGHAALWNKNGALTDLGTLGGTNSYANAISSEDQLTGTSQTTSPDPFFGQQQHPFFWEKGLMTDIGTLGGVNGFGSGINKNGEVVGGTAVNATLVPPFRGPPFFAFHWKDGVMTKLEANNAVESFAIAINDRSQVAGEFSFVDSNGNVITHACLWEKVDGRDSGYGRARDLGTLAGDPHSEAYGLNSKGQVVGATGPLFVELFVNSHAFLWRKGSMFDLNTMIPANTGLQLIAANWINNRGQIAAQAVDSGGISHAILLTPADD